MREKDNSCLSIEALKDIDNDVMFSYLRKLCPQSDSANETRNIMNAIKAINALKAPKFKHAESTHKKGMQEFLHFSVALMSIPEEYSIPIDTEPSQPELFKAALRRLPKSLQDHYRITLQHETPKFSLPKLAELIYDAYDDIGGCSGFFTELVSNNNNFGDNKHGNFVDNKHYKDKIGMSKTLWPTRPNSSTLDRNPREPTLSHTPHMSQMMSQMMNDPQPRLSVLKCQTCASPDHFSGKNKPCPHANSLTSKQMAEAARHRSVLEKHYEALAAWRSRNQRKVRFSPKP